MYLELGNAIVARYNELPLNGGLLSDTYPIRAGMGGITENYPFTVYYILDGADAVFDSCGDYYSFIIQFSVFDTNDEVNGVRAAKDAILDGFRFTDLTGLDDSLFTFKPMSGNSRRDEDDKYWQGDITFNVIVFKDK